MKKPKDGLLQRYITKINHLLPLPLLLHHAKLCYHTPRNGCIPTWSAQEKGYPGRKECAMTRFPHFTSKFDEIPVQINSKLKDAHSNLIKEELGYQKWLLDIGSKEQLEESATKIVQSWFFSFQLMRKGNVRESCFRVIFFLMLNNNWYLISFFR